MIHPSCTTSWLPSPPTHHVRQVSSPIQLRVWLDEIPALVLLAVDHGSNLRQLGDEVHAVLIHHLPVLALVHAIRVGFSKLAVALQLEWGQGAWRI